MSETTLIKRLGRVLSWGCYAVAALCGALAVVSLGWNDHRTEITLVYMVPAVLGFALLGRALRYVLANE